MYSELSISTLESRIGWDIPLDSGFAIQLNQEVLTANSERKVSSFHSLATVENVYAVVPEVNMVADKFNGYLASVRRQSTLEIMTSIFDKHEDYIEETDYSNLIIARPKIFDDAIGYCIAIKILELFLSSSRKNGSERNALFSFNSLKIELYGAKNENGHFIAKGVVYQKEQAIKQAQEIIFPKQILVTNGVSW